MQIASSAIKHNRLTLDKLLSTDQCAVGFGSSEFGLSGGALGVSREVGGTRDREAVE